MEPILYGFLEFAKGGAIPAGISIVVLVLAYHIKRSGERLVNRIVQERAEQEDSERRSALKPSEHTL